ncbi:Synaptobrevin [Penicillium manginii]|uniref:Synaptobrevin n=1 Tax=Penicillium manginii TaxID=203109 RepID=UPI002548308F|nr:Synaptobrevin [Penicillium manginii]KAJ5754963.1 Synaptobrevin [Penicillium manginii]
MAARRLTDEMIGSPNYQDAVVRCILGLDATYSLLAEEMFQNDVEENLIRLIAEDPKINFAKTFVDGVLGNGNGGNGGAMATTGGALRGAR